MSAEDTKQEVKPEEQTLLKDEQPVAEDAPVAPEEPKPRKNWFNFGGKKKATTDVEANVENAEEEEKTKEKKAPWWKKNCGKKGEEEQKADHIAIGIDLVHRDEKQLNNHVQFGFDDIFGEADSQHSWDWVWRANHCVFNFTRQLAYRLLALFSLPFTIIFGLLFGLFTCVNVFILVPFAKLLSIPFNCLALLWNTLIHSVFDPITSSIGLCFSQFTIRKYGINQETTAPCV